MSDDPTPVNPAAGPGGAGDARRPEAGGRVDPPEDVRPLLDAVAVALLDCAPEYWSQAALLAQRELIGRDNKEALSVFVTSPEGHREPVVPSDALRQAVHEFRRRTPQSGTLWRRMTLRVSAADGADWDYAVDITY